MLDIGRPCLLMGDFNVCYEVHQSTSIHSIMDGPKAQEWGNLEKKLYYGMYKMD